MTKSSRQNRHQFYIKLAIYSSLALLVANLRKGFIRTTGGQSGYFIFFCKIVYTHYIYSQLFAHIAVLKSALPFETDVFLANFVPRIGFVNKKSYNY